MFGMSIPIVVTFAIYLLGMILIGAYVYGRTETLSDYILGGRSLNSTTAGLSANASDSSGWILLGLPGWAYVAGIDAMWMLLGLAIGMYLAWKFVAMRLRVYTEKGGNALTIPAFFEYRFEDNSRALRVISTAIILVFFTLYVSSGLVAGGLLFEEVFGIESKIAIASTVVVIVIYTFIGGFLAVSYTDVVQALLMIVALVVVPLAAVAAIGGFTPLFDGLTAREPALLSMGSQVSFDADEGVWNASGTFGLIAIISSMAWGLGYFGQPHILARFMGIRSAENVKAARRISITWVIIAMLGAVLVGLTGIVYFDTALDDPEKVILVLIDALINPWLGGFLLAAILAAVMSTADSQLVVASSALTEDLYRGFVNRDAPENQLVWLGRFAVIVIAVIAYTLALQGGGVLDLVAYAWAGFGSAFGPLVLLSLYWRGVTRNGALAGMITGAAIVVVWRQIGNPMGLYEMVPAFILSALAIVAVSYFSQASLPSGQATDLVGEGRD
ncbi:MAG: sodium/proline symporter PutP [Spiribacter salinus]|uniref:Sodium/proline symporter n=1 Tax=Spiribacter salinus TaxID=1335746 RepID=A0A540VTW2_9GAMM|nr:MAG: sodium/proline symporter PutP [Spiribacter salinus]